MQVGSTVRITTGMQLHGKVGTVVALKPYPEHRNRPGATLAVVEVQLGTPIRAEYDTRELEEIR